LFVSAERATQALNHGKQDPGFEWIRIDGLPAQRKEDELNEFPEAEKQEEQNG
jgi:hypothetical protein